MKRILLATALLAASLPALAESLSYNVVNLQAEASRVVPNDLGFATLYVELNDADPGRLADRVNQALNAALRQTKAFPKVRAESGGQQSYPVYNAKNRLEGWRARAEIRLESGEFTDLSALVGKLQAQMQLASLDFVVAPETLRKAEDALVIDALAAFRQRASLVQQGLAGKGYKIVNLHLNQGGRPPMPMARAYKTEMMAMDAAPAAPQLEAGKSEVRVQVSGSIQLE